MPVPDGSNLRIDDFPFPPSENAAYRPHPKRGLVGTKQYYAYLEDANDWYWKNVEMLMGIRPILRSWGYFGIDVMFVFPYAKVFNKNGMPKKVDVSNRIKVMHDRLCTFLEIDDSMIWKMSEEKNYTKTGFPHCRINLYPVFIGSMEVTNVS